MHRKPHLPEKICPVCQRPSAGGASGQIAGRRFATAASAVAALVIAVINITGASLMELRLVLGDQLNASHSWFRTSDPAVCYLMAELRQETDYCRHHRQKVLAFFAAMHAFAAALKKLATASVT